MMMDVTSGLIVEAVKLLLSVANHGDLQKTVLLYLSATFFTRYLTEVKVIL